MPNHSPIREAGLLADGHEIAPVDHGLDDAVGERLAVFARSADRAAGGFGHGGKCYTITLRYAMVLAAVRVMALCHAAGCGPLDGSLFMGRSSPTHQKRNRSPTVTNCGAPELKGSKPHIGERC